MAVNNSEDLNYILCYTREKKDEMIYSAKLANSMHLAYSNDGKEFHIGYLKTDIEGAMPRNIISISKKAADRLINKLTVPVNVKIEVPE